MNSCVSDKSINDTDRLIYYISTKIKNYEYTANDFYLVEGENLLDVKIMGWNLLLMDKPEYKDFKDISEKLIIKNECKECLKCILKRILAIEEEIKTFV